MNGRSLDGCCSSNALAGLCSLSFLTSFTRIRAFYLFDTSTLNLLVRFELWIHAFTSPSSHPDTTVSVTQSLIVMDIRILQKHYRSKVAVNSECVITKERLLSICRYTLVTCIAAHDLASQSSQEWTNFIAKSPHWSVTEQLEKRKEMKRDVTRSCLFFISIPPLAVWTWNVNDFLQTFATTHAFNENVKVTDLIRYWPFFCHNCSYL